MTAWIGIFGALLLPAAWLLQTYHTYESRELAAIDERFVVLYVIGSAALTVHAFTIRDLPFVVLNLTMTFFTATELALLLLVKRDIV